MIKQKFDEENARDCLYNMLSTIYKFERYLVLTFGLNYQEIYLMSLLKMESPKKMSEVSSGLKIEAFSASRLVARMIEKSLVKRYKAGKDRRNVFISLTPHGEAMITQIQTRSVEILKDNAQTAEESVIDSFLTGARHIHNLLRTD